MTPEEKKAVNDSIISAQVELDTLSKRARLTPQEKRRFDYLVSRVSSLKAGYGVRELDRAHLGKVEKELGYRTLTTFNPDILTTEQIQETRAFIEFCKTGDTVEHRVGETGNPAGSSLQGNLGAFVPFSFGSSLFRLALKQIDPVLDSDAVTFVTSIKNNPLQIPFGSDVESVATVATEGGSSTEVDFTKAYQLILGGYNYRTPYWALTLESLQDIEVGYPVAELFKKFASARIGRGAAKDLVTGNGSGKPLGLIPAVQAVSTPVIAHGCSETTGNVSQTGANSIGNSDLSNLYYAVDAAYRASDKCAFWMNDNTAQFLSKVLDKFGRPLLNLQAERLVLMGKPVRISPSMDDIGSSKSPVAFGDFSFWITRNVVDGNYIKLFKETPGFVEQGVVGLRAFARFDGGLLYNDPTGTPPIVLLQMQS